VSRARRVAVLACREAGRPVAEVCAALGLSDSAASYLVRTATEADKDRGRQAARLWSEDA
ncbi:MAG: hypothetical protein OXU20_36330, partial [Myxococcales bacterium]|nr:hypothetical protein [Myxococcales bacterium]